MKKITIISAIITIALLAQSKVSIAQSANDAARKKIVLQYINEYDTQTKLLDEKIKAQNESTLDVKKDKEKYCKYYSDIKAAYPNWEKAFKNLSNVFNNNEVKKYTDDATNSRVGNIVYTDIYTYKAVGNSAIENMHNNGCMSAIEELKESVQLQQSAEKIEAQYILDIVKKLGDLKPYYAAKENLKNFGDNTNATTEQKCTAITAFKKEIEAIDKDINSMYDMCKELGRIPKYVDAAGNDAPENTKRVTLMLAFREQEFLKVKEIAKALMLKNGCK